MSDEMSVLAPLHHHMLSPWVDILTLVMFKGSVSRMSYAENEEAAKAKHGMFYISDYILHENK